MKLYSGASSAPAKAAIEPARQEQEKQLEEKQSEESTKEVEDKGPTVTPEESLKALQDACTENRKEVIAHLAFCL